MPKRLKGHRRYRVEGAKVALEAYSVHVKDEIIDFSLVADIVVDLFHWCDWQQVDIIKLMLAVRAIYDRETA